jgi:NADPH:quinone reductase-like Zn-dependent oxidoreductase
VTAVGAGLTRVTVGDRVTSTYYLHWTDGPQRLAHVREQYGANHDGWLAQYIVLEADSAVRVPDHLTDPEAASLTCGGVVAWAALTKPVPVRPEETVLIVGTGSVALFAVQFARMHGARVICITSSAGKAKRLGELGAGEVIDRNQTPAWEHAVMELTGGDGVEHVVDAVGRQTMQKSVACGAFNAQITVVGAFPATEPVSDPFGGRYLAIRRIAVGSRADFEAMNRAIVAHRMRPVIDRVLPFEEAAQAYRYFRDGNPFGKVLVEAASSD